MIRNKLKSNTGASLSMALFLFLICTVASAVILTAATVAAGRAAAVDETDARYYAVSSAAELLAKELSGKTVTITRKREVDYVTTTTTVTKMIDDIGVPYSTTTGPTKQTPRYAAPTYQMIVDGTAKEEPAPFSFLSTEAAALMFGTDNPDKESAFQNYSFASGKSSTRNITLTGPVTGMEISGTAELRESGVLKLQLENDGYQLQIELRPKIAETSGTEWTQSVSSEDGEDGKISVITTTRTGTTTKTSSIYWTVDSIRKVVATPHE